MSVPVAKGLDLLVFPVVAFIDASHPGARAADVVAHRFGHLESYAQPLEIRRQGSSQIVQAPKRQRFAFALVDSAVPLYLNRNSAVSGTWVSVSVDIVGRGILQAEDGIRDAH